MLDWSGLLLAGVLFVESSARGGTLFQWYWEPAAGLIFRMFLSRVQ
jgi:hypothetical protein